MVHKELRARLMKCYSWCHGVWRGDKQVAGKEIKGVNMVCSRMEGIRWKNMIKTDELMRGIDNKGKF